MESSLHEKKINAASKWLQKNFEVKIGQKKIKKKKSATIIFWISNDQTFSLNAH